MPPKLAKILHADVSPRYNVSKAGTLQVRQQRLAARPTRTNDAEDKDGYWEVAEGKQEYIYTV